MDPEFFYDFNSPYAYLAAQRVDEVLPVLPRWTPIAFGVIVKQTGKRPWSFGEQTRADGQAEVAGRAAARKMPPVVYPEGWPKGSYSLSPLRAALVAGEVGRLKEFSQAMFRVVFVEGRSAVELGPVLDAAKAAGVDPDLVREGIERDEIKQRLAAATTDAVRRGVIGVPTVAVGDELFWGDDRLEDAAAVLG